MGFLGDFSLGGGRGVLGLSLSGERARLRVAVVEALRIWGAPGRNKKIGEANANECLLEFMEGSRSMAVVEARVAGLLRIVDIVVPAGLVDVANAGTDADGLCAKKSVNFLFLSLKELFAGILEVAKSASRTVDNELARGALL
jgi:hypothetical protein